MRLFNASHLEVKKYFDAPFQTNPYECGWASECIFFIHVEEMTGSPVLEHGRPAFSPGAGIRELATPQRQSFRREDETEYPNRL